ncbi:hypothetical protein [uncultured Modestobacter sp.]|uniref:hypothetical protein n=1 Tax=uncultured Modestobacter sp. TaxID=380048 RepID=UPI00261106B0|nr:hypothetical protein [uncultured Modestobacter sp.]
MARSEAAPRIGVVLAARHSLVGFRFTIEDRYGRKAKRQKYPLAALPLTPSQDTLMAVSAYFESFDQKLDSHKDIYFGEVAGIERRGRTIGATMTAGRGGLSSTLSDPAAPHEPHFRREPRHVERVAIRQLVVVPENSVVGYWIVEAVGLRTLSQVYRDRFRRAFTGRWSRLSPKFEPIVHAEAWDQYEEDDSVEVEEVRFVRSRVTPDRAEALGVGDVKGEYIEIMQSVVPRKGSWLKSVREANYRRNDSGVLEPRSEDLTEVSARVRIGGRETDVIIDREKPVGMRILLGDEGDGRPTDTYFYSRAREWVLELAKRDDVLLPAGWAKDEWDHDPEFGRLGADSDSSDQGTDQ